MVSITDQPENLKYLIINLLSYVNYNNNNDLSKRPQQLVVMCIYIYTCIDTNIYIYIYNNVTTKCDKTVTTQCDNKAVTTITLEHTPRQEH